MSGQRSDAASSKGRGMPRCKPVDACQRSSAIGHRLQSPFARDDGDLPLLKAFKGAILAPKSPEIWRMSDSTLLVASGLPRVERPMFVHAKQSLFRRVAVAAGALATVALMIGAVPHPAAAQPYYPYYGYNPYCTYYPYYPYCYPYYGYGYPYYGFPVGITVGWGGWWGPGWGGAGWWGRGWGGPGFRGPGFTGGGPGPGFRGAGFPGGGPGPGVPGGGGPGFQGAAFSGGGPGPGMRGPGPGMSGPGMGGPGRGMGGPGPGMGGSGMGGFRR